jgi:acetyl-CoA carboxylase biotin carboxyl carrier protein
VAEDKNHKDEVPANGAEASADLKQVQDLYALMREEGLESLELENADFKIRLQRARRSGFVPPESYRAPALVVMPDEDSPETFSVPASPTASAQTINTPLSGVFYRSSSPTNPPYIQEGAIAEVGQTLCIVEAMKVMNEIKAEHRVKVVKILAENSRPVNAGQALFQVEPA